jgi:hypothetical protein
MSEDKKQTTGRPTKGKARRTVQVGRVEPRIAELIRAAAYIGESMADTVTRWAEEQA